MAKRILRPNRLNSPKKLQEISVTQKPAPYGVFANTPEDIAVLARWFGSPCIVGRTLRLLADYAARSTAPRRSEDYGPLMTAAIAWARARRQEP